MTVGLIIVNIALTIGVIFYLFQLGQKIEATKVSDDKANDEQIKKYLAEFKELKNKDNDWAANLVVRNGFINHSDSLELFKAYFDYLSEKIKQLDNKREQLSYLDDAHQALITFSENIDLAEFEVVQTYKKRLDQLREKLQNEEENQLTSKNQQILAKLTELLAKLKATDKEAEIKKILTEATKLENSLHLNSLTAEQEKLYQDLEKSYQQEANAKGKKLNKNKDPDYNKQVAKKLKQIYQEFIANEKDYKKSKKDIIDLVKSYDLPTVNTKYLNNQTMTYYNHIYNYIFRIISDEDKYRLTEVMNTSGTRN